MSTYPVSQIELSGTTREFFSTLPELSILSVIRQGHGQKPGLYVLDDRPSLVTISAACFRQPRDFQVMSMDASCRQPSTEPDSASLPQVALPPQQPTAAKQSPLSQRLVSLDACAVRHVLDRRWRSVLRALMNGQLEFSPAIIEQLDHVTWEGFRFL